MADSRAAASGHAALSDAGVPARRLGVLLLGCAAAFVVTEASLVLPGHLLAAQVIDAVLVLVLVNVGPRNSDGLSTQDVALARALRALALAPLIRVFALGLPMREWSDATGVLIIALGTAAVALQIAPVVGIAQRRLLSLRLMAPHGIAIGCGAALGCAAYLAGAPALWTQGAASGDVALAVVAATCAAVVEELVFRGIIHVTLQRALGAAAALCSTVIFAAMYLEAGTTAGVLIYALAGFIFAHSVSRTASLAGAMIGHVLLAVGAGAAWPLVFDRTRPFELPEPLTTVLLTIAIAIAASAAAHASPSSAVRLER